MMDDAATGVMRAGGGPEPPTSAQCCRRPASSRDSLCIKKDTQSGPLFLCCVNMNTSKT